MPNFLFLDANGQKQGPINAQQLHALAAKGIITPDTPLMADTGHKGYARQIRSLQFGTVEQTIPKQSRHRKMVPLVAGALILLIVGITVAGIASLNTAPRDPLQSGAQAVIPDPSVIPAQAGIQTKESNSTHAPIPQERVAATKPTPTPVQSLGNVAKPAPQQPQLKPGWTPDKIATVTQFKNDLKFFRGGVPCFSKNDIINTLDNLDPMLVGKHVIYDTKWLEYIGPDKPLPQKQFEIWRDKMDMVYESYQELVGSPPPNGKVIFASVKPINYFRNPTVHGHADSEYNSFCINCDSTSFKETLQEIATQGSCGYTAMHEMAHIFTHGQGAKTTSESIVDVLVSYAMETNRAIQYGDPAYISGFLSKTVGNGHRLRKLQKAQKDTNPKPSYLVDNCSTIYTLGLVDKVGWDTYKKVFRSYQDENFIPNKYTSNIGGVVKTCDFLDRLEYFSGKPGILQSLPDKGKILAGLNVTVTERNLFPQTAQKPTSP